MKRVAVIGCPGAGKSTFVRKLGEKIGLPVVHLDYYFHQKKPDYYNNKEAWIKKVEQLINQDSWIIDGNYSSTFELRFKRADTIIFFDFPRRVSMYGVVKRRIKYRNKRRVEMPSDWKEKANWEFMRYVWQFRGASRTTLTNALKNTRNKNVITFYKRQDAENFIKTL